MTAKSVTAVSSCCQDLLLYLQGGFGNKNVRVCMVDTGFDYFHPDLAQNLWSNPGEIPNNGKDDDNNGVLLSTRYSVALRVVISCGQHAKVHLLLHCCQVLWTMCTASTSSRGRQAATHMMTTGTAPLLRVWLVLSATMPWAFPASRRLPAS
jgi:subtilisin family serine protease